MATNNQKNAAEKCIASGNAELQQTEAALRISEERLKLAVASGQVGIWDLNLQTNELIWDDNMFALYGARREDFSGAYGAWSTRLHPEDRAAVEAALQDAIAGIREYAPEFRIVWPDGETHYIKGHAKVIRDEAGNAVRVIGTNWDDSAHAYTQQQLRMVHAAISISGSAFFWVNPQGQVTEVNNYGCKSLGYSREELIGQYVWLFNPDVPAESWPALWEKIKKNVTLTFETRHRRKDGSTFPVEITTHYLVIDGKEYSFSYSHDISERRQALENLLIAASVFDTSQEAILITDANNAIIDANWAFATITGYNRDEVLGKNPSLLSSGRQGKEFYANMWQSLERNETECGAARYGTGANPARYMRSSFQLQLSVIKMAKYYAMSPYSRTSATSRRMRPN